MGNLVTWDQAHVTYFSYDSPYSVGGCTRHRCAVTSMTPSPGRGPGSTDPGWHCPQDSVGSWARRVGVISETAQNSGPQACVGLVWTLNRAARQSEHLPHFSPLRPVRRLEPAGCGTHCHRPPRASDYHTHSSTQVLATEKHHQTAVGRKEPVGHAPPCASD